MPLTRRLTVQKISAKPGEQLLERGHPFGGFGRNLLTQFRHRPLEVEHVERIEPLRIDAVSLAGQRDPLGAAKRLSQAMEGDVKVVPQLRRARLRPERETDLFLR